MSNQIQIIKDMKPTEITEMFKAMSPAFNKMLSSEAVTERFLQSAMQLAKNDTLSQCTAISVIGAIYSAATLNLSVSPQLGQCYILPYNRNIGDRNNPKWVKEAQFQIGYAGYKELMYRSNTNFSIYATGVYKGDEFEAVQGLNPVLRHVQKFESSDLKAVYLTWTINGQKYFEQKPVSFFEALRIRNKDQQGGLKGAWATDYEAMCMAKLIKYCRRFLPLTPDLTNAFELDEQVVTVEKDEKGNVNLNKKPTYEDAVLDTTPILSEEKKAQLLEIRDNIESLDFDQKLKFLQDKKEWHNDKDIVSLFASMCESKKEVLAIQKSLSVQSEPILTVLRNAYKNAA